jgi:hypothetical protein
MGGDAGPEKAQSPLGQMFSNDVWVGKHTNPAAPNPLGLLEAMDEIALHQDVGETSPQAENLSARTVDSVR